MTEYWVQGGFYSSNGSPITWVTLARFTTQQEAEAALADRHLYPRDTRDYRICKVEVVRLIINEHDAASFAVHLCPSVVPTITE